jgi:hypothetical protein
VDQAAADQEYKNRLLELEQQQVNYTTSKPYSTGSSGSSGSGDKTSATATNNAIAGIYDYDTPEEAVGALSQYGATMASQGVDISKVQAAIKARWPEYFKNADYE